MKFLVLYLGFSVFLSHCNKPTYPKENILQEAKKLLKKESNLTGDLHFIDKTLYLEVWIPKEEIITEEKKVLNNAIKKIGSASVIITRLALSTDAEIDFLVSLAKIEGYNFCVVTMQRLQDIKDYLYLKISRGDYEKRVVFEIIPYDKIKYRNITMEEFLCRLIVSRYEMLLKTNPFLGTILGNFNLEFEYVSENKIVFSTYYNKFLEKSSELLLKSIVEKYYDEITKAYKFTHLPKKIEVVNRDNKTLFIISLKK